MTNKDNSAPGAALNAASPPTRHQIALQLQLDAFQRALADHSDAVEGLVQRQVNTTTLTDAPDYRITLIRDVFNVHTGLQRLAVHGGELAAAIRRIMPGNPAPNPE